MPETLDGTYEESLRRIDKEKRDFACRLFQCLVVSKRPLRVEELAELFAIQPDLDTIPTFDARWRPENPEEFILSACSTLVAVVNNHSEKIVQFSHFSVREYLTSERIAISENLFRFHVLPRPAHSLLARTCLSVLLQLDDQIVRDEIQDFPLASYAAEYWVDHAQFDDVASEIQHGMECLFDKDKPHFAAWRQLHDIDYQYSYNMERRRLRHHTVPLYYAALCGFRHLAEHLVNAHPRDVNARGGLRATPLHAALDKGYLSVATLLLERGADPDEKTIIGQAPLFRASKYGAQDATRLLLEHSADPNLQNGEGLTPLGAACQKGHIDIVRILLDYGADAKSPGHFGKCPLHDILQPKPSHYSLPYDPPDLEWPETNPAFLEHRSDIVILLLEHGADANYPDNHGRTPLHIASQRGFIDIVRLLLHHGADPNRPDEFGNHSTVRCIADGSR